MCNLIFNTKVNRFCYIGSYEALVGGRLKCVDSGTPDTRSNALEAMLNDQQPRKKKLHAYLCAKDHIFTLAFQSSFLFTNCF